MNGFDETVATMIELYPSCGSHCDASFVVMPDIQTELDNLFHHDNIGKTVPLTQSFVLPTFSSLNQLLLYIFNTFHTSLYSELCLQGYRIMIE